MMSFAQLFLVATSTISQDGQHESHVDLGRMVAYVVAVVGFLAAVQQLYGFFSRRKLNAANDRLLRQLAAQHDVEDLSAKLDEAKAAHAEMRKQIRDQVPLEARRVFLTSHSDALRGQIASDVEQLEAVERELAEIEGRPPSEIDDRLRPAIERSVRSASDRRRLMERSVFGLLALLALAAVFSDAGIESLWNNYASSIEAPSGYGASDLYSSLFTGALVVALLVFTACRAWFRHAFPSEVVLRRVLLGSFLIGTLSVAVVGIGLDARDDAIGKARQADAAYEASGKAFNDSVKAGSAAARQTLRKRSEDFDRLYSRRYDDYAATEVKASALLWAGHIGVGAALGVLSAVWWLRRRSRRRLQAADVSTGTG